ncbi:MAG: phage GP46 family protein [Promethearchaeota archaeon]
MPNDIKIKWDNTFMEGDFIFDSSIQDLEPDAGLETAILISLFTDRRAKKDDILPDPNSTDKRGWWGDLGAIEFQGDQIGSRLWLLNREKTTQNVLLKAKKYAEESLNWLMEDKIADKIKVITERQEIQGQAILAINVKVFRFEGNPLLFKFKTQWDAQTLR